ncbi:MAG: DUF2807 domain-containing protein [Chitinophagaceae bacterium]|nr:DUF2807 domain-containing protein [Chitinophagaceae bacterium]
MKSVIITSIAFLLVFSSCDFARDKVRGNGEIKEESRKETGFSRVQVSGAIRVYAKQDSSWAVKVVADANLLSHIETYTDDRTLVIRPEEGYKLDPSGSIKVYISSPSFTDFDVSGASEVNTENRLSAANAVTIELSGASKAEMDLKSPLINVELTGASVARLRGETRDLDIDASGASKAFCYDLPSEKATVSLSGACSAEVMASVQLKADASGASHIRYKGSPEVNQSVSGAGSVTKE